MRALVTGCAGFIGSHLAKRLCAKGHEVLGIDSLTDYYSVKLKEHNLAQLKSYGSFTFVNKDLLQADLAAMLGVVDVVFHQAAQPGVRASWGDQFDVYVNDNVLATQRLLEASKGAKLKKFVYASSSSVYGDVEDMPMRETTRPRPISPYGVTKLAAENLCTLYWQGFGVPTASLRYFTVYGPGQRPDMAFHKFIVAAVKGEPIVVYGDGRQTRDFTFVDDIVDANLAAAECEESGLIANVGGGTRVNLASVIEEIGAITKSELKVEYVDTQRGDVKHTWADISLARRTLGYRPSIRLAEGLGRQVEWIRTVYGIRSPLTGRA